MGERTWRIFFLINGIGILLLAFGALDDPIRGAFLDVGILLLIPGILPFIFFGSHVNHSPLTIIFAQLLSIVLVMLLNWLVWTALSKLVRFLRQKYCASAPGVSTL